jgi:hypothetical protein
MQILLGIFLFFNNHINDEYAYVNLVNRFHVYMKFLTWDDLGKNILTLRH